MFRARGWLIGGLLVLGVFFVLLGLIFEVSWMTEAGGVALLMALIILIFTILSLRKQLRGIQDQFAEKLKDAAEKSESDSK